MVNLLAQRTRRTQRYRLWLLVILILLAFGLRLHNLEAFSFWTDEGLTPLRSGYELAEILSNRIVIQEGVTKDTHPPLYYLIIYVTRRLLGESDFAFRYPSLLAGVLLVSLLYQFGRRLQDGRLGLAAAGITAVNPLQIWYGNEARMYTLLVLLAAAAAYVQWRALTGHQLRRNLVLYLLFSGLAFYTHYTAALLIAGQGIFWIWLLWRQGHKRLLVGTAVAVILLAIPLIPFTVPRLFTGAEANYSYVSPLIMLQDVVHGFGQGVTTDFSRPGIRLLDVGLFGLLLTGVVAARAWLARGFLLVSVYAVVFGLMAGSLLKPMYQGVRHIMIGSPAFLLLIAWGLVWLAGQTRRQVSRGKTAVWAALALVGWGTVLLTSTIAIDNLYHNPRYAKNDFRSLIRYVEQRAGPDDVVVYNNAVLLPLHRHYQARADVAVTALPVYPHPYRPQTEAALAALAADYQRVWFVTDPPADKRDGNGRVQDWLQTALYHVDQQEFHARTTLVSVIGFAAGSVATEAMPPEGQILDINWEGVPLLRGVVWQFAQPADQSTLWFDLYWQGGMPPPEGSQMQFSLRGLDGDVWAVTGQYLRQEIDAWPKTGLARVNYQFPLPPGMPPGTYTLLAQPLAGVEGAPLGKRRSLGEIVLAPQAAKSAAALPETAGGPVHFANGLTLAGIELAETAVRPGHNLPLTLYWHAAAGADLEDVRYQLDVVGPGGAQLRTQTDPPGAPWLTAWPVGALIREQTGLYFYPETTPGRYRLRWRLFDVEAAIPGRPSWRPWRTETVWAGEVEVLPWPLVTELPAAEQVVRAEFGPDILLYGYDLGVPNDGRLPLTLYWQAVDAPAANYFTFVHVVGPDGAIISQQDRVPMDGLRPTAGWRPDEVLTDSYTLALPTDLPPGQYRIVVGLYLPDTWERLPVLYQGERQPDDQLVLTTLSLP